MKNTFGTDNQFWTEICSSTGLISKLATASSCLTTWEVNRAQFINDFGVANGFIRPHMKNEIFVLLDKVMTRFPGAAD